MKQSKNNYVFVDPNCSSESKKKFRDSVSNAMLNAAFRTIETERNLNFKEKSA